MAYEDITGFSEVDPSGYWTLTTVRAEIAGAPVGDTTSCVYKSYGAGHFGDYVHFVDVKLLSNSTHNTGFGFWAVTNDPGGYYEIGDGQMLYIKRNATPSNDYIYLRDAGNTNNDVSSGFTMQQTVYVRVQRSGTTCTAKIYSTAYDRDNDTASNLIDTLSITCVNTTWQYLMAGFGGQGHSPFNVSGWAENFNLNTPSITQTIDSDAQISGKKTIDADSKIVIRTEEDIVSDTQIRARKTIDSDAVITPLFIQQNIDSDTKIVMRIPEVINSDTKIVNREQKNINSDAKVVSVVQKTITSNSVIKGFVDFIGRMRFQVASINDFIARFKVNQPTPTAPTLSGIDLETGNSVYLSWTDAGNYGYNIYAFIGGIWVKQNIDVVINLSFVVGSLTNGTPYTFMVRGVNGEGTESTNSNSVIVTPTFSKNRTAIYKVYIGGTWRTDAILKSIEIVYGPSFSTVVFELLKPITSPPVTDTEMYVTINDRRVFTGRIVTTDDRTSSSGLSIEYTCICKLWEYTWDTIRRDYNTDEDLAAGILFYTTGILQNIGVTSVGLPVNYPGQVSVKDSTKLSVMTTVLGYCGNYKIYTDPYGNVSYYKMGTGPNRTLSIGNQILEQNIRTDISEKVDKVTVYNEYSQQIEHSFQIRSDELDNLIAGKGYLVKDIYGYKVSDVQVEVLRRPYPEIIYASGIEVLPGHVGLNQWANGDTNAKAPISEISEFSSDWTGLAANVDYESRDRAKVYIPYGTSIANPRPNQQSYTATFYDATGNVYTENVVLVVGDTYFPTMIRVTYKTERVIRNESTIGSGRVRRTFNEDRGNIYQRAQAEYDKLSIATVGGEIIILGDETMDLCTKVNSMDVTRVFHDFSQGFITRLTLSNEPYYRAVLGNMQKITTLKTKETIKKTQVIATHVYLSQDKLKYLSGILGIDPNVGKDPKLGGSHYSA